MLRVMTILTVFITKQMKLVKNNGNDISPLQKLHALFFNVCNFIFFIKWNPFVWHHVGTTGSFFRKFGCTFCTHSSFHLLSSLIRETSRNEELRILMAVKALIMLRTNPVLGWSRKIMNYCILHISKLEMWKIESEQWFILEKDFQRLYHIYKHIKRPRMMEASTQIETKENKAPPPKKSAKKDKGVQAIPSFNSVAKSTSTTQTMTSDKEMATDPAPPPQS